ncbi:MAG TPA: ATP-binding protein [Thermoanaerobaculia bacterium]|nr:ATP-binding protein [Thermoanaerobaculia bacterium]
MIVRALSAIFAVRFLLLVAVIALIGWLDFQTGPDIGLSLFYLVPVVVAAWYGGAAMAMGAAVCASTAWFLADHFAYSTTVGITIWNSITRLVIYSALGLLVARLRGEKERLERVNAELDAFSRSVSHDLRAPLIQIGRYAEMIDGRAHGLDDDGRRYLSTITNTASDGLKLIDDLLEFAQVARTEVRRAAVNLGAVVEKVRSEFLDPDPRRSIRWRIEPLPVVRGDGPMLEVAMRNVIGNAIKYTRPREEALIEIGSYAEPDGTVVWIRDNGVGFNPEYASKLFGVFERLHGHSEFEGSGIGLAIVERIVSRHGGRVWAEGAVDGGATFYMKLPEKK